MGDIIFFSFFALIAFCRIFYVSVTLCPRCPCPCCPCFPDNPMGIIKAENKKRKCEFHYGLFPWVYRVSVPLSIAPFFPKNIITIVSVKSCTARIMHFNVHRELDFVLQQRLSNCTNAMLLV